MTIRFKCVRHAENLIGDATNYEILLQPDASAVANLELFYPGGSGGLSLASLVEDDVQIGQLYDVTIAPVNE